MAYSGYIDSNAVVVPGESSSETRYFRFSWTSEQTATSSASKSKISWTLTSKGGYTGWVTVHNIVLNVNGVTKYTKESIDLYPNVTVATGSFTLTHNGTSNASFQISLVSYVYYSSGSSYKSAASKTFYVTGNTAPTSSISSEYTSTYNTLTITPTISKYGSWATSATTRKVQVYYNDAWKNIGTFTSGAAFTINNLGTGIYLDPSTTYKIRLYVVNNTYKSGYSDVVSFTTAAFTRPSLITNLTLTTSDSQLTPSTQSFTATWKKPTTVGDTTNMHYRFRLFAGTHNDVTQDENITMTPLGIDIQNNSATVTVSNIYDYMERNLRAGEYLNILVFAFKEYNDTNYFTRGQTATSDVYTDSYGNQGRFKSLGPCGSGQATMWIKTDDGWENGLVYVNDNGTWRPATKVYIKVNGSWEEGI